MIVTDLRGATETTLKCTMSENLSSLGYWLAPSLS